MLKIILFGLVCVFGFFVVKLTNAFLNPKEEKVSGKSYTPHSFAAAKEELESKIEFYKRRANEGSIEAKEKLEYYQQELEEINVYQKFRK